MTDSLQPRGLQHARLPCLSPSPGVCSNWCPLSWWCQLTLSSSISPFFCLQSFPASGSFPVSPIFASCGQSIRASASASVLPMNIHSWSLFGLTGLISLLSKGLSRLISSTTIQKHQFFYGQPSLWTNSQIPFLITSLTDYWKNHSLSIGSFVGNVICLLFNTPSSSIVTFFPRSSPLAAVPFSSDYSIKLQFPPPAATHTSYILVWDTCFENKTRPQMDGNVSKVWTDMRSQGREESTTLIVVGNVL